MDVYGNPDITPAGTKWRVQNVESLLYKVGSVTQGSVTEVSDLVFKAAGVGGDWNSGLTSDLMCVFLCV